MLFGTVAAVHRPHADGMPVWRFIGDAAGALLIVLVVPVAILVVGTPVALLVRLALSAVGLL